jgi:hypothetical protein
MEARPAAGPERGGFIAASQLSEPAQLVHRPERLWLIEGLEAARWLGNTTVVHAVGVDEAHGRPISRYIDQHHSNHRVTEKVVIYQGGRGAGGESLYAPAPSFAGFGEALVSEARFADPPRESRPQPEAVEVEIDDGRRV